MKKKLTCVMLVDDDKNDNFIHEREIKKASAITDVITKNSGKNALDYLKSKKEDKDLLPDLIFLDINMPCMNGWEFLDEFSLLDKELQDEVIIVMLTSSNHEIDLEKFKEWSIVSDYLIKPLTKDKFEDIVKKYFNQ